MAEDEAEFPVDRPERKKGRPAKGSPEAKAIGRRLSEARERKRAEAGKTTSSPKRKTPAPAPPVAGDIATEITEAATKAGALMLIAAPIPGTYVVNTADQIGEIVGRMAERNPKLLAALQGSSNVMDYIALGAWGAGLVAALGVQTGRVYADSPFARATGITEIVDELEGTGQIQTRRADELEPEPVIEEAPFGAPAAFEPTPIVVPTPPIVSREEMAVEVVGD